MKNWLYIRVWVLIIMLIFLSALIANSSFVCAMESVLVISMLKFSGISFYFMGLRKAHIFWKSSVVIFVLLFSIITMLII